MQTRASPPAVARARMPVSCPLRAAPCPLLSNQKVFFVLIARYREKIAWPQTELAERLRELILQQVACTKALSQFERMDWRRSLARGTPRTLAIAAIHKGYRC